MRFIPTSVHGPIDYVFGLALVALPWAGGFAGSGPETAVPVAIGALVIIQSLFTDYELSAARVIPTETHLWTDVGAGAFLAASPWLFGFADHLWLPHVVFGLMEAGLGLCTRTVPGTVRRPRAAAPGV